MAAAQQRRDDVKAGVVGGCADEPHLPRLDIRQEQILLGFIETVDFVDEQHRALGGS
jgi:hypothetical protein